MVKCPNCNTIFNIGSFICPHKVSITKRKKIANLSKHLKKDDERAKTYVKVSQIIDNKSSTDKITSKMIIQIMDWSGHSDGDATLTFLDYMVCKGILIKIRHKKGRGGHLYKRTIREICPYFKDGICTCNLELYHHINEEKEENGEYIS
jgi:hypothetical protein